MKELRKILVFLPHDREPMEALSQAIQLRAIHGAAVTVVDVVDEVPASLRGVSSLLKDVETMVVSDRMDTLVEKTKASGLEPDDIEILRGSPAFAVAEEAVHGGYDLVMKSAYGPRSGRSASLSTTGVRLMRQSAVPVWIVRPTLGDAALVAAAVDPLGDLDLARKVLETAAMVASARHARLVAISSWEAFGAQLLRKRSLVEAERYLEATKQHHAAKLQELVDSCDLAVNVSVELLAGGPDETIPAFVRERDVDVLVAGTIARSGIPGLVIGNTAEKLLAEIDCSLVVVRP